MPQGVRARRIASHRRHLVGLTMTQLVFGEVVICRSCRGRTTIGLSPCPVCHGSGITDPRTADAAPAAEAARDAAIDRVSIGAEDGWVTAALEAVRAVAMSCDEFTTDEVWAVLDRAGTWAPREPRAMGAVLNTAARRGWIVATDRVRRSLRIVNHARPQRVWRSLTRP